MQLQFIDWTIIVSFFVFSILVGLWASKKAGSNTSEFFLSGKNMPWWLLGISMVATTFSVDTPNLVTDLVRQNGVAGNWSWWAFLVTGMLTVFVYAKLWRRSDVLTDIEFYELRYSGKPAAFLRGFRALYLGLIFNVFVMGGVSLAAIKFGEIILGLPGWQTLLIAGFVTLVYSTIGGLRAVIVTDFVLFILAMIGSIWATIYILNLEQIGGLSSLLQQDVVRAKMDIFPDFSNPDVWIPLMLIPLAVQWWASYYPGAEPGGGGYIAQRMLSAKNERNAIGATFLFNLSHYALRPWPWILIALASLVVFPELKDLQQAFPNLSTDKLGHDVAYPAMLTLLPKGLLGLVAASLIAAFMSTMSTQLNLGASYLVNDFYKRFINPNASDKQLVKWGRMFSVLSMILGVGFGLILVNAKQAFDVILLLGSGTGLIFILRWFWWRINAYTEIIAMISSLIVAIYFTFLHDKLGMPPLESWQKFTYGTFITSTIWMLSTFITPATSKEKLINFYKKIQPGGWGWKVISQEIEENDTVKKTHSFAYEILSMLIGCLTVYGALIATGNWIYGNTKLASILTIITIAAIIILSKLWKKIKVQ